MLESILELMFKKNMLLDADLRQVQNKPVF